MTEISAAHAENSTTVRKTTPVRKSAPSAPTHRRQPLRHRVVTTVVRTTAEAMSVISPRLAGSFASRVFLSPPRPDRPGWERKLLSAARPFRLQLPDGRRLAAWRWLGHGPTVLLAHGWGGRGSQLATLAAPLVEAGFTVVTFDAPGHGDSDGRLSSLPAMAAAVHAAATVCAPLGGIIAHSAGAIATTRALADGLRAPAVVYLAPGTDPVGYTHVFAGMLGLSEGVRSQMQTAIERRVGMRIAELDVPSLAADLDLPLLIVHDRDDRETPIRGAEELTSTWRGARLIATEGLGHRRILRDPAVVERTVGFLRDLSQPLTRPAA